jgi:hypothetical protein
MERTKDPMVKFRSVIRGKNSKGGDRFQLYIGGNQETGNADLETFIQVLQEQLGNPKGAKVDLHISQKEYEGRKFDSAIAFVKATGDGAAPTKRTFVPRGTGATATPTKDDTASKAAAIRGKSIA